jgi:hypothetical protein
MCSVYRRVICYIRSRRENPSLESFTRPRFIGYTCELAIYCPRARDYTRLLSFVTTSHSRSIEYPAYLKGRLYPEFDSNMPILTSPTRAFSRRGPSNGTPLFGQSLFKTDAFGDVVPKSRHTHFEHWYL